MLKVLKFGGSSLSDAGQFKKVADIIRSDPARRYVVVSAPGKRGPHDEKITDLLLQCFRLIRDRRSIDETFEKITSRYDEIVAGLGLDISLKEEYDGIRAAILHHADPEYITSRGEYLSARLMAQYLDFPFIDAEDCIFFNEDGTVDLEESIRVLKNLFTMYDYAVIPGFYGQFPDGSIETFSRGGSDITGSIVAAAANADVYENWTDVSGMLMADPRIVDDPKTIEEITYRELRELSYMGATVLHDEAIFPVRQAHIPTNIRNTNIPDNPGTMIVPKAQSNVVDTIITGVAGKRGMTASNIEKDMMNSEIGFGKKVLEVLEEHGLSFEHLPSGIDTMTVIINSASLIECKGALTAEIVKKVNPDSITVTENLALIAVVGRGMIGTVGSAARVFSALSQHGVDVKMIDQGSSQLSVIIGVDEKKYEDAIRAIYDAFVK